MDQQKRDATRRTLGGLLAAAAGREGGAAAHEHPFLLNDALLASSCRERGITLITKDRDFDRLLPFLGGWRHVGPWPSPGP